MPVGEALLPSYPGLLPESVQLWRLWLAQHEAEFAAFEYNVPVGPGAPAKVTLPGIDPDMAARIERRWLHTTRRRIDALGWKADAVWVIEIAESASGAVFGQVLSYAELLPVTRLVTVPVVPVILARYFSPDSLFLCQSYGIIGYQVTPEAPLPLTRVCRD